MSEQKRVTHPLYSLLPADIAGFDSLAELALDMRWSWNHATDNVWRQLDPELWDITQNPWVVLQTVSRDRIERALADPVFRRDIDGQLHARREAAEAPAWFQQHHPQTPLSCVAYFSMEFMLSEALPIYSGGLGNVAGDQLKAASDLGVPVVGVGLLFQQGYFRQVIDKDGAQEAVFPYNDPGQLPITPLREGASNNANLMLEEPPLIARMWGLAGFIADVGARWLRHSSCPGERLREGTARTLPPLCDSREVMNELSRTQYFALVLERRNAAADAAREMQDLSMQLFVGGLGSSLDLLYAQVNALQSRLAVVDISASLLKAVVALIRALGGGWSRTQLPSDEEIQPFGVFQFRDLRRPDAAGGIDVDTESRHEDLTRPVHPEEPHQ